jgi:hypothetical protein
VCCVAQHSTNGLDLVVVYSVVLVYGHRVMPAHPWSDRSNHLSALSTFGGNPSCFETENPRKASFVFHGSCK